MNECAPADDRSTEMTIAICKVGSEIIVFMMHQSRKELSKLL